MVWKLILGPSLPIVLLAVISIYATVSSSGSPMKTVLLIAVGLLTVWALIASVWAQGMAGWIQQERHKEVTHLLRRIVTRLQRMEELWLEQYKPESAVVTSEPGYVVLRKPSVWRRLRENMKRVIKGLQD
jgi:hypothetical protein